MSVTPSTMQTEKHVFGCGWNPLLLGLTFNFVVAPVMICDHTKRVFKQTVARFAVKRPIPNSFMFTCGMSRASWTAECVSKLGFVSGALGTFWINLSHRILICSDDEPWYIGAPYCGTRRKTVVPPFEPLSAIVAPHWASPLNFAPLQHIGNLICGMCRHSGNVWPKNISGWCSCHMSWGIILKSLWAIARHSGYRWYGFSNSYQLQQCCWHPGTRQFVEHCSWPVWHICMCGFSENMVIPLSMEHQSPLGLNFWRPACHSQPNLDVCTPCRYKRQKVGAHTESALPSWCLNSSMLSQDHMMWMKIRFFHWWLGGARPYGARVPTMHQPEWNGQSFIY